MKKMLQSQSGMSMINVMIAGALVAGMALTVSKMGKSTRQLTKSSETTTDLLQVQNRIERTLLDDRGCMNNLYKVKLQDPGTKGTSTSVNLSKIVDSSNRTIIESNESVQGSKNISVQDIELLRHYKADIANTTTSTKKSELELIVTFFKGDIKDAIVLDEEGNERVGKANTRGKDVLGGGSIKKRFYLSALFDKDGNVDKCYSQLEAAVNTARRQTCNDVGGVFETISTEDKYILAGRNSWIRRITTGRFCRNFSGCPSNYPDLKSSPLRSNGCTALCTRPLSKTIEKCNLLPRTKANIVLEPFKKLPEQIGVPLYKNEAGAIVADQTATDKQEITSGNSTNYYCNCRYPSDSEMDSRCSSKLGQGWTYDTRLGSSKRCSKGKRKGRCSLKRTRNTYITCAKEPVLFGYLIQPFSEEVPDIEQCTDTKWFPDTEHVASLCATEQIQQRSNCGRIRVVNGGTEETWIHTSQTTQVETNIESVCSSEQREFENTCTGEVKTMNGEKTCLSDLQRQSN